jgi:hypothetical protein
MDYSKDKQAGSENHYPVIERARAVIISCTAWLALTIQ